MEVFLLRGRRIRVELSVGPTVPMINKDDFPMLN